ncbi:hypothetical protein B0H10DRAFT_2121372 [Mycena sp. CBHHK59/15]|nr:hypothetical protein B0H10DRAFT_2121372 [Mycena sp. CBHHK59/15]
MRSLHTTAAFAPPPEPSPVIPAYAQSLRNLYTGTGTGTSLRTDNSPVVPVRAVRRVLATPRELSPAPTPRRNKLAKAFSGLFKRRKDRDEHRAEEKESLVPGVSRARTFSTSLSIRRRGSVKVESKEKKVKKSKNKGIEHRAIVRRSHSFSGFVPAYATSDDDDDEAYGGPSDELAHEAILIALSQTAEWTFERLDAAETRELEEFVDREGDGYDADGNEIGVAR